MVFDFFAALMAILSVLSFGAIGGADVIDDTSQTEIPGADLIAGEWIGSSSVPFAASVAFYADVKDDGTVLFSGSVTSSLFGNHEFSTDAEWEYLGGDRFNAVISNTNTAVICNGNKITFQINPYKLGLVENKVADREFTINLHRI